MIHLPNTPTIQALFSEDRFLFETKHWLVVLRSKQVTIGATVLIAKSDATSFSSLMPKEFLDLQIAIEKLEDMYQRALKPDKINYLALMMVDPNPHFHVLPRYAAPRTLQNRAFVDAAWPKPTNMADVIALTTGEQTELVNQLRNAL
jgi:diadenosine tetraphosphate (Ap4A) HIT family hydrolase